MYSTYAELVQELTDYLRADTNIVGKIDLFIGLAESDMNRELRTSEMEVEITDTITGGYIDIPSDLLQIRNIRSQYPNGDHSLRLVTPEIMSRAAHSGASGPATFYSVQNNQIQLAPGVEDNEIDLLYYQRIPALTDTNTTNWVITNWPLLYWYGCLSKAWEYREDDSQEAKYSARFAEEVRRVQLADNAKRWIGQSIQMQAI